MIAFDCALGYNKTIRKEMILWLQLLSSFVLTKTLNCGQAAFAKNSGWTFKLI